MTTRRALVAGAILAAGVSFTGLDAHSPWLADEPRVAGIGREMLDRGDWITPRLNGKPFLEKPPLYWWAQAASYRVLGVSDPSARLPSAIFGFGTLLVTFAMGASLAGAAGGLASLAALASTREFFSLHHEAMVDPALVFFVALGHLGFLLGHRPRGPGDARLGRWLLAAAVPLAFLSKGSVGAGLCLAPPLLLVLVARRRSAIRWFVPVLLLGAAASLLLVGGWLLALGQSAGAGAVRDVVFRENLGRFLGTRGSGGHARPAWYYLANAPNAFFPWILALPAIAGALLRARGPEGERPRALFGVFALGILLLSGASGKRILYLAPLDPALAACVGWWLARAVRRAVPHLLDRATLVLLAGGAAAVPPLLALAALLRRAGVLGPLKASTDVILASATGLVLGVALLPASLALALAVRRAIRRGRLPGPVLVLAPLCILTLVNHLALEPLRDPLESLRPLTAAISRLDPGRGPVAAFRPREGLIGMIYFDLGRPVRELATPEEVEAYLRAAPARRLVYRLDRARDLDATFRAGLEVLYRDAPDVLKPYAVAAWRPAGGDGGSGPGR